MCQSLVRWKIISLKCLLVRLLKALPWKLGMVMARLGAAGRMILLNGDEHEVRTTTVRTLAEIRGFKGNKVMFLWIHHWYCNNHAQVDVQESEWGYCRGTHAPDVWWCIKKSWFMLMALEFKPWFLDDYGKAYLVNMSETMFSNLVLWCSHCALFSLNCNGFYKLRGCNELMKWQWIG